MSEKDEMSFLGHLEELRWHLLRATLAIVIFACVAFFFKGFIFDFGPSYRFEPKENFTPFVGIQATYFNGKQTDTNYPTTSGKGLYGEGGPETDVDCKGITPNIGAFINSGYLKGFGLTIDSVILSCDNDAQRSYTEGYDADFNIINYRIDYRKSF